jgi:hypothetical protein
MTSTDNIKEKRCFDFFTVHDEMAILDDGTLLDTLQNSPVMQATKSRLCTPLLQEVYLWSSEQKTLSRTGCCEAKDNYIRWYLLLTS